MNKEEAREILDEAVTSFGNMAYEDLAAIVDAEPHILGRTGRSGVNYQLEIEVMWDAGPGDKILVIGSIDDGGWRSITHSVLVPRPYR